ncbi:MAG: desV [Phenylobacterium sp.]|nr:desV [Phenylobacterium sp.]
MWVQTSMLDNGQLLPDRVSGPKASPSFARLVDLQLIESDTGTLGVADAATHIGFPVLRTYFLTGVPNGKGRGGHAHKTMRQCFICLRGQVTIVVSKRAESLKFRLTDYSEALVVDPGCWRDLYDFSSDALLLVLASQPYTERDYIRDHTEFLEWELAESEASVPFIDLARQDSDLQSAVADAVHEVIRSGVYIGGPQVAEFEAQFAEYCGAAHAVGVGNGLEALALTLAGWGVGPGDEVIVPAHTFIATALAVDRVGAVPVLVDVEADTGLMDPALVQAAITPRTRAVIPVHLYGQPADIDGIREAIGGRDIKILEDAAQAHGAFYRSRRCGALGDAAAFSFYPTKNLGALGDGGAVVTDDPALAAAVRRLGNYGGLRKYEHQVIGGNSRLDPMQAAVLSAKLPSLDRMNARRAELASLYLANLADLHGLALPKTHAYAQPVWHVFAVRCEGRRDELFRFLAARNINANIHYPAAIHQQACYAGRWPGQSFPVAEMWARDVLSLPLDGAHTNAEILAVIEAVTDFLSIPQHA